MICREHWHGSLLFSRSRWPPGHPLVCVAREVAAAGKTDRATYRQGLSIGERTTIGGGRAERGSTDPAVVISHEDKALADLKAPEPPPEMPEVKPMFAPSEIFTKAPLLKAPSLGERIRKYLGDEEASVLRTGTRGSAGGPITCERQPVLPTGRPIG
jgi:hypothetical protein